MFGFGRQRRRGFGGLMNRRNVSNRNPLIALAASIGMVLFQRYRSKRRTAGAAATA